MPDSIRYFGEVAESIQEEDAIRKLIKRPRDGPKRRIAFKTVKN